MNKSIGIVYEEDDYSVFKHLHGNRSVEPVRIQKITESINKVGWVRNPIIVNENMEIVDGQGRFEVLKQLKMPIQYVVAYGAGVKECQSMNIGQGNWKPIDFVKSYAELGNASYALFLNLINRYPQFTLSQLVGVVKNDIYTNGSSIQGVKNGSLVLTQEQFEEVVCALESVIEFIPYLDKIDGSQRVKYTGVVWVLRNTKADRQRLLDVIKKGYPTISPVVDTRKDIFLADLSELYNKRLSPQKCLYFDTEYKQFAKEKAAAERAATNKL